MNKTLSVALALVAGLAGAVLTRYIAPPSAFAQNQAPVAKEVRAQSFTLVDPSDRTVGTFEPVQQAGAAIFLRDPQNPGKQIAVVSPMRIVLRDSSGHELWSAGGSSFRTLSER